MKSGGGRRTVVVYREENGNECSELDQRDYPSVQFPAKLSALEELANNLWWCWNEEAVDLFKSIDPLQWMLTRHNPIALLDKISLNRYKELENDEEFVARLAAVYAKFSQYMEEKKQMNDPSIAYFSMEYGLHASLKIYSGGLGVLAGDYLKEASDKKRRSRVSACCIVTVISPRNSLPLEIKRLNMKRRISRKFRCLRLGMQKEIG